MIFNQKNGVADKKRGESGVFAQLSDSTNQQPTTTLPAPIKFNTNDFLSGVKHGAAGENDKITILEDGAYFLIAGGQVGREGGVLLQFVDMWFRVNGKDAANTNTRASLPEGLSIEDTIVLITQMIMPLSKGDVVQVMFSISDTTTGIGLLATKPVDEPLIPSCIFTMYKI